MAALTLTGRCMPPGSLTELDVELARRKQDGELVRAVVTGFR